MIDTNLLLSIGFSLITNFTSLVPVPEGCVPKSPANIHKYAVGIPGVPTYLHVTTTGKALFAVNDGAVCYFDSHQSSFGEGDPSRLREYTGDAIFSTNQVLLIVSNTLQRLIKGKGSLGSRQPRIVQGGIFEGKRLPFFHVQWPSLGGGPYGANADVDGRNGRIVLLSLFDDAFFDPVLAQKIVSRVYTPEIVDEPPPVKVKGSVK